MLPEEVLQTYPCHYITIWQVKCQIVIARKPFKSAFESGHRLFHFGFAEDLSVNCAGVFVVFYGLFFFVGFVSALFL